MVANEKEIFKDKRVAIMVLLILPYVILIAWKAGVFDAFAVSLLSIIGAYIILKKKEIFESGDPKELINKILKDKRVIIALILAILILGMAGEGAFVALMGFLFYIIGVLIFVYHTLPTIMLPGTGAPTPGVIDKLVEVEHYSGGAYSKYNVYYSFEIPDGKSIWGRTQLSKRSFTSLMQGQPVRVCYVPDNPEINRLADYRQSKDEYIRMIAPPLIGCVIGVFLVYFFA